MNIITLTTDFGERDYAVGALKGQLYSLIPNSRIVDISHRIEPFKIQQAAYVLKNAFFYFPKNTIHIIGVDNELDSHKNLLVMKYKEQFFICADNGFFSLLCKDNEHKEVYKIHLDDISSCFPTLDFSTFIAQKIIENVPLHKLGDKIDKYCEINDFTPIVSKGKIEGHVIYIDYYGNVVSNITRELIEEQAKGRNFDVFFRSASFRKINIKDIFSKYNDIEQKKSSNSFDGEKLLLFNHSQHLELAIYKRDVSKSGGASSLFGLEYRDKVSILFIDQQ